MGKIRVKTLGDEAQEKKDKLETKKRKEQKKLEVSAKDEADSAVDPMEAATTVDQLTKDQSDTKIEAKVEKKPIKKEKFLKNRSRSRSKKYLEVAEKVEKNKIYGLNEALSLLPSLRLAKFDETVELHMNTNGTVSGTMTLPHGTGKTTRVAIADGSDAKGLDELLKKIESNQLDFDVLIATPDAMPKLARVARILGPRGLMPNPKNGTVTPKPDEIAKKFAGGQTNYKTEAKAPILHMVVGKMSFGDSKLSENILVAIRTVDTKNIKNVTLKSTMSPGLKLDISSF